MTHTDYYAKDRLWQAGKRGNRVATILTILEAPKAGKYHIYKYFIVFTVIFAK